MAAILRTAISNWFPWMEIFKFLKRWFNNNIQFGSGNGLAPNRRQAIILTNDGLAYRWVHASLIPNEFRVNEAVSICKYFATNAW